MKLGYTLGAILVATAATCGLLTAVLFAQSPSPSAQDTLTQLLNEVHGLRLAMEQTASAGPRVQLALGRLSLQEQRISALNARLAAVRDQIREAQTGTPPALKTEESALQGQIQTEQANWAEINRKLEELERALNR